MSLAACGVDSPEELSETTSAVILRDSTTNDGQRVVISEVDNVDATTLYITSCSQGVLYSTRSDGSLWLNRKGGLGAWIPITSTPPGKKIACDRRHIFSLNGTQLYHAELRENGQLATAWSTSATNDVGTTKTLYVPEGTTEISSGNGNIYATAVVNGVGSVQTSQLWEQTSPPEHVQGTGWVMFGSGLGATRVTGAGSKAWFNSFSDPGGLHHVKRNRAFGVDPNNRLFFNSFGFEGQNYWTEVQNPGLTIQQIAADDSNTLYALVSGSMGGGFGKRIVRFSFTETNCRDNLDNDANGLTDAEDSACRGSLATEWCQTRSSGSYCIDRIENTDGFDHALVTCQGPGTQPRIQNGLCQRGTGTGNDSLVEDPVNPEPLGSGHYCSVLYADGRSAFSWTGDDPCQALLDGHNRSYIARAGIYSKTGPNNAHVTCDDEADDFVADEGIGDAPLRQAKANMSTVLAKHCVITVSPRSLEVFNAPFPRMTWQPPTRLADGRIVHTYGRGYQVGHVFDHAPICEVANDPGCPCSSATLNCLLHTEAFGQPDGSFSYHLDNRGIGKSGYGNEVSYDFVMNEGVPLRSLGYGRVLTNGSRERDISGGSGSGTPYQGEIAIRYDIGTNPRYRESFVGAYVHVGQRVVVSGQTVEPGQLIGFVGTTGASSRPHVHFGVIRLSNTNLRDTAARGEDFGYHMDIATTLDGTGVSPSASHSNVDPYGWRVPVDTTDPDAQDPAAYRWRRAKIGVGGLVGIGAWSPRLWRANEVPPYPELPPDGF